MVSEQRWSSLFLSFSQMSGTPIEEVRGIDYLEFFRYLRELERMAKQAKKNK